MTSKEDLTKQLMICRVELKNLRENMFKLKKTLEKNVQEIRDLLSYKTAKQNSCSKSISSGETEYSFRAIGYIESWFKTKNGTPRQPIICPESKAKLKILKSIFNNPKHSLLGLEEYSHVWIIFVFHKSLQDFDSKQFTKAKVQPPRLNGKSVGLFSTRSPHRPNPIGLTLTRLEKIEDGTLYFSGVDLLDGTPVIDIKPYIPIYDIPKLLQNNSLDKMYLNKTDDIEKQIVSNNIISGNSDIKEYLQLINVNENSSQIISELINQNNTSNIDTISTASWINEPSVSKLTVIFSSKAECELRKFHKLESHSNRCMFCLEFLHGPEEAKKLIKELLEADPRSVYRKKKCLDKLYYFTIDKLHVTAWFDENAFISEVLRIIPSNS